MSRAGIEALSADLDVRGMAASLEQPQHAGFGICELDIERMKAATGGRVWVEFAPTRHSPSHVRIHGCAAPEVEVIRVILAEMVHIPTRP